MSNRLPDIQIHNLFEMDTFGQRLWKYHLGSEIFERYFNRYHEMGLNGAMATPFSNMADKNGPKHYAFNSVGERIDSIIYDESYKKLKELSYGSGIVAQKYSGPLIASDKVVRHRVGFSTAYYFAQTETGLFCPICMTDALGRVLEMHAVDEVSKEVLRRLKSKKPDELWEGAMFLTERQGGSDVGANEVEAIYEDGHWKLYGLKWFCSNADADAILVLARVKDPETNDFVLGTKGLGLFLLTRNIPEKNHKNWEVRRLKEKLGVRSMASAEIDLKGAVATQIGGVGEGFRMMTDMVNMSRIYNSVASLAISRRSILESYLFAEKRTAFGKTLVELPLFQQSLSELQAEFIVLHFLIFECVKQLDLADEGSVVANNMLRILTPLSKALSGKFSVFASAEAMELIGGNAYIEDHIMPRLYRDAQVLPIWEGTTQIQSLDILRSLGKDGFKEILNRMEMALVQNLDISIQTMLKEKLETVKEQLKTIAHSDLDVQQKSSRKLLEYLGKVLAQCLVYEAATEPEFRENLLSVLKMSLSRDYMTMPLGVGVQLNKEETKLILDTIV